MYGLYGLLSSCRNGSKPVEGIDTIKDVDHIGVRPYEIRINKNIEICRKTSTKDECNNR